MPGRRRTCRTCGQATIPAPGAALLLQYLAQVHGELSMAPLPNLVAEDQPGDDDPQLLRHRRDKALATLRWAIAEATRTQCIQCERIR